MSEEPLVLVPESELKTIKGIFDLYNQDPKLITTEMRQSCLYVKDKLWTIKKHPQAEYSVRLDSWNYLVMIYKVMAWELKEDWKPKESNGKGGGKTFIASKQLRVQNCKDFIEYLGPTIWNSLTSYEQAMALGNIWGSVRD